VINELRSASQEAAQVTGTARINPHLRTAWAIYEELDPKFPLMILAEDEFVGQSSRLLLVRAGFVHGVNFVVNRRAGFMKRW